MRRPFLTFLVASVFAGVTGCRALESATGEQVDHCLDILEQTGGFLMIGTEGGEELCDCTVDRIAQSYPDAADQWEAYALEVTERLDRRGVLGMVADSVWLNSRGEEIAEFAAAQGEALSQCSQELLNRTMGGIE